MIKGDHVFADLADAQRFTGGVLALYSGNANVCESRWLRAASRDALQSSHRPATNAGPFVAARFDSKMEPRSPRREREIELFRQHGGGLRMAEALRLGINRKTLYAMRDAGVVEPVSRGVYRLASLDPLAHPDLVTVAKRVPQGVLCLISALSYHELTTQVPHTIDVALERGKTKPRLDYPPTRFFWFSGPAFHEGIETHELDGVPIRIYGPEKTLVDCFRYRNQIGMDVALEALRLWRERRRKKLDVLLKYARMRHVERAMRPYLEAMQ